MNATSACCKRFLWVLLAALLVVAVAGCGPV
jgi:predicted small lipoprotein YifL